MLTYLGVYVGLVLTKFGAGRSTISTPILAFWAIVLTVFVGSREWVGCDFSGYLLRFNFYQKVPFEAVTGNAETGFLALNYLVINMGLGYPWLNFFAAVIFFGCAVAFVLKRGDPLSILALMFPVLIVQLAMSGLRQALAVALLMLAWNAFVSRLPGLDACTHLGGIAVSRQRDRVSSHGAAHRAAGLHDHAGACSRGGDAGGVLPDR